MPQGILVLILKELAKAKEIKYRRVHSTPGKPTTDTTSVKKFKTHL